MDNLAIAVRSSLYDQLLKLPNTSDRIQFFMVKGGLDEDSIVHQGDVLLRQWCYVLESWPFFQGRIDLSTTEIVFVREESSSHFLEVDLEPSIEEFKLTHARSTAVMLRSMVMPINPDLVRPELSDAEDDSLLVFADPHTLLHFGLNGGSFARLFTDEISRIVKVMVLLAPHGFETGYLYTSPRLMAIFKDSTQLRVEKCIFNFKKLPVASSVSLARVGSWNNGQRLFEKIISSNLISYLTKKTRVLKVGDLLPITFDSSSSQFYAGDLAEIDVQGTHDSIAWFKIENVEVADKQGFSQEFRIDSKKSTLLTQSVVNEPPLRLSDSNYLSYFGLPSIFHYDLNSFDYAKRFLEIMKVGMKCRERHIPTSTSVILQSSTPCVGKSTLVRFAAHQLGIHLIEIDCLSINSAQGSVDAMNNTIGFLKAKLEPLLPFVSPSIVFLSHLDSLVEKEGEQSDPGASRLNRSLALELASLIEFCTSPSVGGMFVGSMGDVDKLPDPVRSKMQFVIDVPVPTEQQRQEIFDWYLEKTELNSSGEPSLRFRASQDISSKTLALRSAGLSPNDIRSIVQTAKTAALKNILSSDNHEMDYIRNGHFYLIKQEDLISAIEKARDEFSDSIGAPKIPSVTWADIGGMDLIKDEIMDTIDLPLRHPELFSSGMKKRSGVLFYGPPGTGKTLLAKAIATNFSLNFFSVKGPELLNMYIGESEANVRRVFQKARDAKPCVIFFDELDSVAPKRGNQGDSGGVMDRIVSQLLAELDGMSSGGDGVFVIGATNRPDLLDEALLRPGRFDKLLYLGIPDTNEKQENILQALSRKFVVSEDVDLPQLAQMCPFNYTGADFYALCSDSMLNAMTRTSREVDKKVADYCKIHSKKISVRYWFDKIATEEDANVVVKMQDFLKAQNDLTPSVSQEELNHYLSIKRNFEAS